MSDNLESRFEKYVRSRRLIANRQSPLLAVSGGMDSMVMLHLFVVLRKRFKLKLSVIHVNHHLRGEESVGDERFVKEAALSFGIPCFSEHVNVLQYMNDQSLSKQAAARVLRYECFEKIRQQTKSDAVATAHHADDNAETILLNILRGTGIHGLAGIPPKRKAGKIIRPILFATRVEIEAYAKEHNVGFRNDSSNNSVVYRRNELRHNILPVLKLSVVDITKKLNATAEIMYDVNKKMQKLVDKALNKTVKKDTKGSMALNLKKLKSSPDFLQDEIFVELLNRMEIEPTEKKVDSLRRLCSLSTGKMIKLTGALSAHRNRNQIVFKKSDFVQSINKNVEFGGSYDFNGSSVSISKPEAVPKAFAGTHDVEYIDAEQLKGSLVLRQWQSGDWFIPLGMKSKKKVSDYFTDQKIPRYQKSSIPVLESNGSIVWICGKRLDDRFKLTKQTKKVIRLTYQPTM